MRFSIRRPAASRSSSVRRAPAACAAAAPDSEAFRQRGGGFKERGEAGDAARKLANGELI